MTVSLQYIQRVYGEKLRKIETKSRSTTEEKRVEKRPQQDSVVISEAGRRSMLTPASSGVSGSMLQKKLAIQTYQTIAKGLPSMLK